MSSQLGGAKRKRRRRRGRRGGSGQGAPAANGQSTELATPFDPYNRFGEPDEIDTTPRDEPVRASGSETAEPPATIATPNAASSPVWSLTPERAAVVAPEPLAEEAVAAPVLENVAEPVSLEPEAPTAPSKKGWWQRTFRTEG
jgi:ribonuclease E